MSFKTNEYYYNHQLRKYILQFMAIFSGLQVQVGKSSTQDERLITVPIHYATSDRVVAAIINSNTQNKVIRLPVISAYIRNIDMAPELYAGTGVERRQAYTPVGGLVPDDTRVTYQRRALPFRLSIELNIYASNTDQHFQILEQILPLFDPQMQLQKSDAPLDMTRLTEVTLKSITNNSNMPLGTDRRVIQSTLAFEMPVYLDTPTNVRKNIIEQIFLRVGAVSTGAMTSADIIAELDDQNIPYENVAGADSINFE